MIVITKALYSFLVFTEKKATNHRMYIGFSEMGLTDKKTEPKHTVGIFLLQPLREC